MELKYGSTSFDLDLPPERLAGVVTPSPIVVDESPVDIIEAALDSCSQFMSSIRPGDKIVIITSDVTRYTGRLLARCMGGYALQTTNVTILLAECRDGFGNGTFFSWFRHKGLEAFETALRAGYEINGQTAYSVLQKALRFRIVLVSEFPLQQFEEMALIPARTLDEAMGLAVGMLPADWRCYLMPDAGSLLPVEDAE